MLQYRFDRVRVANDVDCVKASSGLLDFPCRVHDNPLLSLLVTLPYEF